MLIYDIAHINHMEVVKRQHIHHSLSRSKAKNFIMKFNNALIVPKNTLITLIFQ
jgi:hypothetical protein